MAANRIARIHHRYADVGDVRVFYRETGVEGGLPLLLLHGFPSGSQQYRRLIDALGADRRIIAPDYPGFGLTEAPEGFEFSFERLADVIDGFVERLGLDRFAMYQFDFGGPIGMRLAERRPDAVAGLVIQNANAYDEGLSDFARAAVAERHGVPGAEERLAGLFTAEVTRGQYEGGTTDRSLVAPDGWTLDQHYLDLPGRNAAQLALALDYHSNVARYPVWQQWLREHRPPTLVLWGVNDAFFPQSGAAAYRNDLPDAEVVLLDTGHFALEERLEEIAPRVDAFLARLDGLEHEKPVLPGDSAGEASVGTAMRIAVIGASGNLGRVVVAEARERGHEVTELGRGDADATDAAALRAAVAGHDAVVAALKGPDQLVPRAARALLDALPRAGVERLVFLGGGGSLEYEPGRRFVDAPGFPAEYFETARDQGAALQMLMGADTDLRWSYVSPPPMHLVPGAKTGAYRAEARDTPITDASGDSRISTGDYAAAVIDEVERSAFAGRRFTVAY